MVTDEAVAVNDAPDCPLLTVTLGGTVTLVLLLFRDTLKPPEGATALRPIVQDADPGALTLAGVQENELITGGPDRVTVVPRETELAVAVTVAVWLELTWAAEAVKFALV